MKRLLITRPLTEAQTLAPQLSALGFAVIAEPLLAIEPVKQNLSLFEAYQKGLQAVLITSRHALYLLKDRIPSDVPLFCVGRATAELAATCGFLHVHSAETAQRLVALVEFHCKANGGPLLYARGEHVSSDISSALNHTGFTVDSVILYRAIAATHLTDAAQRAIATAAVDGALFFSRRTAEIYHHLIAHHGLAAAHPAMTAIAMSAPIAEALTPLPWRHIEIARAPDMAHMLTAVKDILSV